MKNKQNVETRVVITYPNQKVVTTVKAKSDEEHLYTIVNLEAQSEAARSLTDRAFKLYHYFTANQDGYTFGLSPADVLEKYGMKDDRYRAGVKELIEKGYLVHQEGNGNVYKFYESPRIGNVDLPESDSPPVESWGSQANISVSPPNPGVSSVPFGTHNPVESRGEIIHDNTNNNTTNNIKYNKNNNINNNTSNNTRKRSYPKNINKYLTDISGWDKEIDNWDDPGLPF